MGECGVGPRTASLYLAVGLSLSHLESWQLPRQVGQAGLEVSCRSQSDGWEGPTVEGASGGPVDKVGVGAGLQRAEVDLP